jgi:Uma2 family endonuclease
MAGSRDNAMAASSLPTSTELRIPLLPLRRFTVDEYHRMIHDGILGEHGSVELLEGLLVTNDHSAKADGLVIPTDREGRVSSSHPLPIHKFTHDEYHRMLDAGVLIEGGPEELLDGWIVSKMSRNPAHEAAVFLAEDAIRQALPKGWFRRVQSATTTKTSEPEPDVSAVRGKARDYLKSHPMPKDIGLAVEIANTSLTFGRNFKGPLNARERIPVYWIINLIDRQVEVYSEPAGKGKAAKYRRKDIYRPGEDVLLVLDGKQVGRIAVDDLLP